MKPFKSLSKEIEEVTAEFISTGLDTELIITSCGDSVTLLSDEAKKLTRFLVKFYVNGGEALLDD